MSGRGSRTSAAMAVAAALALSVLAGCGTGSPPSPPTGVDELEVPTPSPDPDDFATSIDNPWLALDQGPATFTASSTAGPTTRTVVVGPGPVVEGVATTSLTAQDRPDVSDGDADLVTASVDHYAQDRAGNVWWFGREGVWTAGEGGAEAGLVMPAEPRLGDGFRQADGPGLDLRAEVVGVGESVAAGGVTYDDAVVLEITSGLDVDRAWFVRDVGLVLLESATGVVELERAP